MANCPLNPFDAIALKPAAVAPRPSRRRARRVRFVALCTKFGPAERHEMIAECDKSARAVEAAFEKVEASGSIEVVLDVVLTVPEELDRRAHALRDPGGFGHEIAAQTSSEAAADPCNVDRDVRLRDTAPGARRCGQVVDRVDREELETG